MRSDTGGVKGSREGRRGGKGGGAQLQSPRLNPTRTHERTPLGHSRCDQQLDDLLGRVFPRGLLLRGGVLGGSADTGALVSRRIAEKGSLLELLTRAKQ